jgi:hypothetical protein
VSGTSAPRRPSISAIAIAVGHPLGRLQQLFALSGVLRLGASLVALRMEHASGRDVVIVARAALSALPAFQGQLARVRRGILAATRW